MKQIIGILIVMILMLLAGCQTEDITGEAVKAMSKGSGTLKLVVKNNENVQGAEISLKERGKKNAKWERIGYLPQEGFKKEISSGKYTLKITLPSYQKFKKNIKIKSKKTKKVNVRLKEGGAELKVKVKNLDGFKGGRVLILGEEDEDFMLLGNLDGKGVLKSKIDSGFYLVKVDTATHDPFEGAVQLKEGSSKTVEAELELSGAYITGTDLPKYRGSIIIDPNQKNPFDDAESGIAPQDGGNPQIFTACKDADWGKIDQSGKPGACDYPKDPNCNEGYVNSNTLGDCIVNQHDGEECEPPESYSPSTGIICDAKGKIVKNSRKCGIPKSIEEQGDYTCGFTDMGAKCISFSEYPETLIEKGYMMNGPCEDSKGCFCKQNIRCSVQSKTFYDKGKVSMNRDKVVVERLTYDYNTKGTTWVEIESRDHTDCYKDGAKSYDDVSYVGDKAATFGCSEENLIELKSVKNCKTKGEICIKARDPKTNIYSARCI